LEDVE